jgi:hypothetical protein
MLEIRSGSCHAASAALQSRRCGMLGAIKESPYCQLWVYDWYKAPAV